MTMRSKRLYKLLEEMFRGKGGTLLKKYQGSVIVMIPHFILIEKKEIAKIPSDAFEAVSYGLFSKVTAGSTVGSLEKELLPLDNSKGPADLGFET